MTTTEPLRTDLTALPDRIQALPVFRGYPVPWFVAYPNGTDGDPDFRVADSKKWIAAVQQRLCWVCGQALGTWLAFVLGPISGITRVTAEPATHRECAEWSIYNCPFLSRPHMVRREANLPAGTDHDPRAVFENLGVSLLWMTKTFSLIRGEDHRALIRVGAPLETGWFTEGRRATREEAAEAFAVGLPKLVESVAGDPDGEADLQEQVLAFEFYLPAR